MSSASKPRSTITPDAFTVAPQLLGLPLASPSRRLMAMGVDLLLVAMLIKAGGLLLGITAAFALWRFSIWTGSGGIFRQGVRLSFRVAATIVVFLIAFKGWGSWQDSRKRDQQEEDQTVTAGRSDLNFDLSGLNLSTGDAVKLATLTSQLGNADEDDARQRADSIAALLRAAGASKEQLVRMRPAAILMSKADQNTAVQEAIDSAFGVPAPDALAHEQQQTIALLTRENQKLREERDKQSGAHGVKAVIASAADDLGLGFGWMAVYFTSFLGLMRGQTPGKRLVGIRVVRLDAKPISWWIAFERFGGYAASATMGLLGFLQILWDRNRQGFHDKAVDTVVVRLK